MMNTRTWLLTSVLWVASFAPAFADDHGLAMHGHLKYPASFSHFAYVNENAPKGGTLRLSTLGTFDSFNPFIIKGTPAAGLNMMGQGLVYESLMTKSEDEPFSMYGLLAQSVDLAPDRSAVTFTLNPAAKWQDGTPVTPQDVKWTFETMMAVGSPFFKAYFGDVATVRIEGERKVTFTINNKENRELPLILGELVVLPKHYWDGDKHDITKADLNPIIGSGAYKIESFKPGAQIVYARDPNWWGKDLPVNRGRYNFDRLTFDYYRDQNVALEAFFGNQYDVRSENVAKLWATGYRAAPVKDGRIIKAEIPHAQPVGMQAFIFNIRRPQFADVGVRQALGLAFDYNWANKQLADSSYTRTDSFFENSELGATDLPSPGEIALLTPFRDQLPPAIFSAPFANPETDGSGNIRANLKQASEMLDAAGYKLGKDGVRVNDQGVRLEFEFVDANPALERWINPFLQNLKKIGVIGRLRIIDPTQYQNRMNDFDFDMTTMVYPQSDSPGNEQRDFWGSAKADVKGSRNYIGIRSPVVDTLVEKVIAAPTREDLVTATRALDRVLLNNYYVIPGWHFAKWRVAWWNKLDHPMIENTKSLGIDDTWWMKPDEKK
jgi:microcin C transport system substrate-binding protein